MLTRIGYPDLVQLLLRAGLEPLGQLVRHVGRFVDPAALLPGDGPHLASCPPNEDSGEFLWSALDKPKFPLWNDDRRPAAVGFQRARQGQEPRERLRLNLLVPHMVHHLFAFRVFWQLYLPISRSEE